MKNLVREFRLRKEWSQIELAERAGISRAAVSAIESGRIVPSVAAALQLASVFACSVEELFGAAAPAGGVVWATPAPRDPCRFWHAEVNGRVLYYPTESTTVGYTPHDGVMEAGSIRLSASFAPRQTLVVACCDPAVGLLAAEYERASGFRLLVLPRSSRLALDMVRSGTAHVAGLHLATASEPEMNARLAKEMLDDDFSLLAGAHWDEGLAVRPQVDASSVEDVIRSNLVWIGREAGSGARQCLEELLPDREAPAMIARDHRGVADAIRCGWADVGVCLKLPSEEAGLRFLSVRTEAYDLCFPSKYSDDPRIQALIKVMRSTNYRDRLAELPGYGATVTGELTRVGAAAREHNRATEP
ncbi:MAG: substrate-binding domain-containing protein [Planctomycetota bacterium]